MSDVTHQLKVYGSVFSPEPVEVYELPDGVILGEWLADNVKGFDAENSELAFSLPFDSVVTCEVDCHLAPKGSVFKAITKIFTKVLSFFFSQKQPSTSTDDQRSGSNIELSSSTTQTVKYGLPIREAFGRTKIVPDNLVPPRRYFENKKDHWVESFLCVGVGDFLALNADIKTGNSYINDLGGDNYAKVYQSGQDVSAEPCAHWWHTSKEVGPTSTGESGIPLGDIGTGAKVAPPGGYAFSGKTITPISGQEFPTGWVAGVNLNIDIYSAYLSGSLNVLTGDFPGVTFNSGDTAVIFGGRFNGSFIIDEFYNPAPSNPGSASYWDGTVPPELDYTVSAAQFIINIGSISGVVTLTQTFSSVIELITEINSQIAQTALSGSITMYDGLKIKELPNYSGRRITVNDLSGADRVFGNISAANSATVIGQSYEPSSKASAKLDTYLIPAGDFRLAVSRLGEFFRVVSATANLITVEKVNAAGTVVPWAGWVDDFTTYDSVIEIDSTNVGSVWKGPFSAVPGNELCTHIEIDVLFPQGLIQYADNGAPSDMSASISFRYREDKTKSWTYYNRTYTEKEKDQIGFTELITLPQPMHIGECQLQRVGAESSVQSKIDRVQWFGLKARMARQKFSYPQLTTMSLKLSGAAISAQSDSEVSIVATRKLDGVVTRSISDAVKYIARNTDIDIASFAPLDAIWDVRGDTFDFQFNKFTTVKSAANTALSAGFADFTVRDGLLTPIREAARPHELLYAFNHTYSAQNTTGDIVTQIKMPDPDEIDGYDVEYIDSNTWRVETVRCQQVGSLGNRIEKITADGITNRTKAYQWGMRALMTKLLDSMSISTKTELDAKNSNYGDYVSFVQEVPEWSQSAIVESVNGLILTSTEPLNWVGGAQHVVALQMPNGRMSELQDATQINEYQLSISASWSFIPTPHTTALFFGVKDRFATAAIVRNLKPSSNSATISASVYNADIYQYDDAEAPQ